MDKSLTKRIALNLPIPKLPQARDIGVWQVGRVSDASRIQALYESADAHDRPMRHTHLADTKGWFAAPWRQPDIDSVVLWANNGMVVAHATVDSLPGDLDPVRVFCNGVVHPKYRRRGIGTQLVQWQRGQARRIFQERKVNTSAQLIAYADERALDQGGVFRAAGFCPQRWFQEMSRDIATAPRAVAPPSGIEIVGWPWERFDDIRKTHNASFADHWGSQPHTEQSWEREATYLDARWSAVAVDAAQKIIGYVLTERREHDWLISERSSGFIKLLGVAPRWRRQGIAGSLLTWVFDRLRHDGIAQVNLDVDVASPTQAHRLYAEFGFAVDSQEIAWVLDV